MNFLIVGPTAVGKSGLALELAETIGGEIVNADAFQLYRGLDLLTAKPGPELRARVRHHLLGSVALSENLSAARFRQLALPVLGEIAARNKHAIVVSGSGLYLRALSEGFDFDVPPNAKLRDELANLSTEKLAARLRKADARVAAETDPGNPRRIMRALEILAAGKSGERRPPRQTEMRGVFLTREREDLYARINSRVEEMFRHGVEAEVHALTETGPTAEKALGLREIRELLAGRLPRHECIAKIQQATRQYAKRQLTWFRHQTSFPALNLTVLSPERALSAIATMIAPE